MKTRSPTPICGAARPDPGRVQHGLGEVLDQPAQLGVEVAHRLGRRAQHRVTEQTDRLDAHENPPGRLTASARSRGAAGSSLSVRRPRPGRAGPGRRRRPCARCGSPAPRAARGPAPGRRRGPILISARSCGSARRRVRRPLGGSRPGPARGSRPGRAARPSRRSPRPPSGGPVTEAIRTAGGKPSSARSASSRSEKRDRIPADEGLHRGQRRLGQHHHRPGRAGPGRRRSATGAAPPRRRAGWAGRAAPSRPAAARRRSRSAATGSAPGVAMTSAGSAGTVGQHVLAARGAHRHAGEGPAQLLRGARRAGDQRAQPAGTAPGAGPVRRQRPAPPAAGHLVRAADLQRPAAGGAPGLGAAPGAGDGGQVAAPRHLDQDRPERPAAGRVRCRRRAGGRCAGPGWAAARSSPRRPGPVRPRRARP